MLTSICWGANDWGQGYDNANQTPYLDSILRNGLDWLIKAHPEPNALYVQVGDGDLDYIVSYVPSTDLTCQFNATTITGAAI